MSLATAALWVLWIASTIACFALGFNLGKKFGRAGNK